MANNTMWLVNTRTNHRVLLAKYYPSTGWYPFGSAFGSVDDSLGRKFDAAGVADTDDDAMDGGRDWVLCYEGDEALNAAFAADSAPASHATTIPP